MDVCKFTHKTIVAPTLASTRPQLTPDLKFVILTHMPIYEYRHKGKPGPTCEETFEIFQKMSDDALTMCPVCDGAVEKILSRFSGASDRMAPSRLKDLGFTKLVRRDKGVYEKE